VEKSPVLGAKISQDFNIIPTSGKKFFPHLACISSDYIDKSKFIFSACHEFVSLFGIPKSIGKVSSVT
jgi:hypothetical protein